MSDKEIILKPCPFCGVMPDITPHEAEGIPLYGMSCHNDDCDIQPYSAVACETKEEMIKTWNTRKGDTPS